jgi:hypothetical protein
LINKAYNKLVYWTTERNILNIRFDW